MAEGLDSEALTKSIRGLTGHGVVPAIATPLNGSAADMVRTIEKRILAEVEAFSRSANPDLLPELGQHLEALAGEVCRLLGGGRPGDFAFVQGCTQRRAKRWFLLEASLHSYRCSLWVIYARVRVAALPVAAATVQVYLVVGVTVLACFSCTARESWRLSRRCRPPRLFSLGLLGGIVIFELANRLQVVLRADPGGVGSRESRKSPGGLG